MSRFISAPMTCMIAMVLTMGAALMASPAEAARLTKAEKVALKQAVVACKAEAKGKKIKWLSRRKYVKQCVVEALKEHPTIDVARMLKENPGMRKLPVENWPGY
jgi:pyruvate/2-oxoglutarate dehydrogenase complex dihydrolipoamide acyltransferase (E2) component